MKKILLTAIAVGAIASSVWSQGVVTFKNTGSGANGSITFGSANVTLNNSGTLVNLSGTAYTAGLWLSTDDPNTVNPIGTVNFGTGAFAGTFAAATFAVPGVAVGGTANLIVRAWDNAGGTITTWSSATIRGQSNAFNVTPLGNPIDATTYPILVGMNAFSIAAAVPEPSIVALATAGAGLLLLRRKARK
jgi:hypothetical protein